MPVRPRGSVILALSAILVASSVEARQKPALTASDYERWETLGRAEMSPDGAWLAVSVGRVNEEDELQLVSLGTDFSSRVPFGSTPSFSSDSRWVAYAIDESSDERERLEAEELPVRQHLGLMDLVARTDTVFDEIASFEFSDDGRFLAMLGFPPEGRESADLLVLNLGTRVPVAFGNVSRMVWSEDGASLAMAVETESGTGNGVNLFEPSTGGLRTLDSSNARYRGLTWRPEGKELAVFRAREDPEFEEETHAILLWRDPASSPSGKETFDPSSGEDFPQDMRVVEHRGIEWSADGERVFFGIRPRWRAPEATEGDAASATSG